jgi:DNA/RNA endonuclease YhcR with UshA esterase domain
MKKLFTFLLFYGVNFVYAQFHITGVTPARNGLNVANNATITAQLNSNIDASTLNFNNAKVYGSMTGFFTAGSWSGGGTSTISYTPSSYLFKRGETITVEFTTALKNESAVAFTTTQQYQFTVSSGASGAAFVRAFDITVGTNPQGVGAADLDGDGDIDISSANWTSSDMSVAKNNGNATFAASITYASDIRTVDVSIADLNNDGDMDIIAPNNANLNMSVFTNNGNATSFPKTIYNTGSLPANGAVADVNGDGKIDIIIPNSGVISNSVSIFINNGNGTFASKVDYGVGTNAYAAYCGDFNSDGSIDIVASNGGSNTISILLNNGNGTFQGKVDYAAGLLSSGVYANDLDGDGDIDIVASNYTASTISVFKNNGNGTFQAKVDYPTSINPWEVNGGDFNGDGSIDILTTGTNPSTAASVLLNKGNGTFSTNVGYSVNGTASYGNFPFDYDADGDLDLMISNFGSNTVSIAKNIYPIYVKQNTDFISATTGSYNYGPLKIGTNTVKTFTITNTDPNHNVTISSIVINGGTGSSAFTYSNLSSTTLNANTSLQQPYYRQLLGIRYYQ